VVNIEDETDNIPKVVPETPPTPSEEEPNTVPDIEDDTEELPEEIENIDESFTLPELEAKLEAQLLEAQRLFKDANFVNNKK
jgi:hypothetical protein